MENNILFPPIVDSAMTPQLIDTTKIIAINYKDPFDSKDYKYIRARVTRQANNLTIVNTVRYLDGFIYKPNENNGVFIIDIAEDLKEKSENLEGELIKIQLSYVDNTDDFPESTKESYGAWLEKSNNSEWSSVLMTKFIKIKQNPQIGMIGNSSLVPKIWGDYSFSEASKEFKNKYKFDILLNNNLIESSGWLQSDVSNGSIDTYQIKSKLENFKTYIIKYSIISQNGYKKEITKEYFTYENFSTFLVDTRLATNIDYENGCVDFSIYIDDNSAPSIRHFVISRAEEKDNFSYWQDIYFLNIYNEVGKISNFFTDYTLESGVEYKYALQEIREGVRTHRVFDDENSPVCIYLQYAYLYANGVQLKLNLNNKVSSFKHTVLASKQDTIGSRYPTILRNGMAYYAEFPIAGLISLHQDDGRRFFREKADGLYYQNELIISSKKYEENPFDVNQTGSNIYIERLFREKVESFLNDGQFKLYRSPTEGNLVVALMNVSTTPNQQLSRMVSDFSATAYEVMDSDYATILNNNLIVQDNFISKNTEIVYRSGKLETNNSAHTFSLESSEIKRSTTFEIQISVASGLTSIVKIDDEMPYLVNGILYLENQKGFKSITLIEGAPISFYSKTEIVYKTQVEENRKQQEVKPGQVKVVQIEGEQDERSNIITMISDDIADKSDSQEQYLIWIELKFTPLNEKNSTLTINYNDGTTSKINVTELGYILINNNNPNIKEILYSEGICNYKAVVQKER